MPAGSESEHITRYSDGTEIRYDRDAHALTIMLAAGERTRSSVKARWMVRWRSDTLTVQGKTQMNSDAVVTGNFGASGEIEDGKGTMNDIRRVHNDHDHPGTAAHRTGKPNQKM